MPKFSQSLLHARTEERGSANDEHSDRLVLGLHDEKRKSAVEQKFRGKAFKFHDA